MRFKEPHKLQLRAWNAWVANRPASIQEVIAKHKLDPWTLYKLKTTGQRVYLLSFNEPGEDGKVTCRVGVSGEFNLVTFERDVFGIDPADLEECDLPGPDEQLGSLDLPIDVVKNLRETYPVPDAHPSGGGVPQHVMIDLIARYPLRRHKKEE